LQQKICGENDQAICKSRGGRIGTRYFYELMKGCWLTVLASVGMVIFLSKLKCKNEHTDNREGIEHAGNEKDGSWGVV
ncbi:MAG: hypothetical protein ACPGJI_09770, partial [Kangiellaceae bacterium]